MTDENTPSIFMTAPESEVLDVWTGAIADVIWWFNGFAAAIDEDGRANLPDINRLRELRRDLDRMRDRLIGVAHANGLSVAILDTLSFKDR